MLLTIKELLHHPGGMSLTIKGLLQSLMIKELHYQRRPGDVPHIKGPLHRRPRIGMLPTIKRLLHKRQQCGFRVIVAGSLQVKNIGTWLMSSELLRNLNHDKRSLVTVQTVIRECSSQ